MEYVFGREGTKETLRTKGAAHTDLTGWQEVERRCGDVTIKDTFLVLAHTGGSEDSGGSCYDWYIIDKHYRYTERDVEPIREEVRAAGELNSQTAAAATLYVRSATNIQDADALRMPDLFKTWAEALLAEEALEENTILNKEGKLYRVVQRTVPQAWQPPDGEGMLAIYRPIEPGHAGTPEDPIPWTYGMDCRQGQYFSYELGVWLCKADMIPCVWAPGTEGLWQWEYVKEED